MLPCNTPNPLLYPCTQTSAKGRAHNLEQVANFYQQWDSSSAEKVLIKSQCLSHLGGHFQDITFPFYQQAPLRPHKWKAQSRGDLNLSHVLEECPPPHSKPHCKRGEHCFSSLQSCTRLLPLLWHPGTSRTLLSVRDQSSEAPQWPL